MAGIVAALEAHDDVGLLRQPVDDLALPFVAPLGADDDNIGHARTLPFATSLTGGRFFSSKKPVPCRFSQSSSALISPLAVWAHGIISRFAEEADTRIKEAGRRRKQEGGFAALPGRSQALDIPVKFMSARWR